MKILYLVHQFYPRAYTGTEKFILQLAQSCQQAGHQVQVVAHDLPPTQSLAMTATPPRAKDRIKRALATLGLRPTQLRALPGRLLPNRLNVRRYVYQGVPVIAFAHRRHVAQLGPHAPNEAITEFARELLRTEQPDLIHAGHLMRGVEILQVAAELGIPYAVTLTDFWALCPNCKLLNARGQLCAGPRSGQECKTACPTYPTHYITQRLTHIRQLLTQAAVVVTPAHFLAARVQAEFGRLPLRVIPYGTDVERLQPQPRPDHTAAPLTFGFAGTFQEAKGVQLLLQAFQALSNPAIRLVMYGSGKLHGAVQQATQVDRRISYGGVYQIEALPQLLSQIDVVIVPSTWHENMPLIMQEAQACGVPTLVADVGGMTECVTDGVNGFTFRIGDGADLQRKMQMIIDQPELLNRIKANMGNPQPGQYRVTSLEEAAALYLQAYEEILAPSTVTAQVTCEVLSSPPTHSTLRPDHTKYRALKS